MNVLRPPAARPIFMMFGMLLMLGGCIDGVATLAFLKTAKRTSGVVRDPGPGGRHATIAFHLPTGQEIELAAGGIFAPLQVGEGVPVLYKPKSPADSARLDTLPSLWSSTVLMEMLGVALLTLGRFRLD